MKRFLLLTTILLLLASAGYSQRKPKPLENKRYTWNQLKRRGYQCEKFKGRKFLTFDRYMELITHKTITK